MIILIISGHVICWAMLLLLILFGLIKGTQSIWRLNRLATYTGKRRDLLIVTVLWLVAFGGAGVCIYQLLVS